MIRRRMNKRRGVVDMVEKKEEEKMGDTEQSVEKECSLFRMYTHTRSFSYE